jgi:hypothetical protein
MLCAAVCSFKMGVVQSHSCLDPESQQKTSSVLHHHVIVFASVVVPVVIVKLILIVSVKHQQFSKFIYLVDEVASLQSLLW